jgi:hypothetical protein
LEEEGRDLPLHKRNDLLHVDAFPSVSENSKGESDAEILAAQELEDRLKIVLIFPGHSNLAVLYLALNLGAERGASGNEAVVELRH